MDLGSSAQVYEQTKAALMHFRDQRQSASVHAARFYHSDVAREQRQTLLDIESFVRKSIRRESARHINSYFKDIAPCKGLNDQLLSLTVSDRERETKIVEDITSMLEKIQNELLAQMSESEMLTCVEAMQKDSVMASEHIFREKLEYATTRLNEMLNSYEEKSKTTKEEVEQRIIATECEKNKKLNKFEQATKHFVRKTLDWKIELDWEAHQKDLSNMKIAVSEMKEMIGGLEVRIQMFNTVLQRLEQKNNDSNNVTRILGIGGGSAASQSTENSESRILSTSSPSPTTPQADEINICDQDPTAHSQLTTSLLAENTSSQSKPEHATINVKVSTLTTDTATENLTINIVREDSAAESMPTDDQAQDHEALLENNNATHAKSPLHESRHSTPVNLSFREKEYDHNKENTASPLSVSSKKSVTLAFDGLDKYARTLFLNSFRSPSATPK